MYPYSFTEEEFVAQVKKSKSWGEPTDGLLDMMEEMIIDYAMNLGDPDCNNNARLVEASIKDFESNDMLQGIVNNVMLDSGQVIEDFRSSICCTFKHHKRRL